MYRTAIYVYVYINFRIATRTDVDWIIIYDFIFDRLRSVRQDAAIQRIDALMNIQLLEPIVRFLVYSAQRYDILCFSKIRKMRSFNRMDMEKRLQIM